MFSFYLNFDWVYLHVWYMGRVVAIVDCCGEIVAREEDVPLYLIEYLIMLPRPEVTIWN